MTESPDNIMPSVVGKKVFRTFYNTMGQSSSAPAQNTITSEKCIELFNNACALKFTAIEKKGFYDNMEKFGMEPISREAIVKLLNLPIKNNELADLIYNFLLVLCNYPFMSKNREITSNRLLKAIGLLRVEKIPRLQLIFVAFALEESKPEVESITIDQNIWSSAIVQNMNDVSLSEISISKAKVVQLFTLMLICWRLEDNETMDEEYFLNWSVFQVYAERLTQPFDESVSWEQFEEVVATNYPRIMKPIASIFNHLVYVTTEMKDHKRIEESKLMNEALVAQLSTILPTAVQTLKKLYIGRDSGFSMRSFQSKAFKWNAPSILLISGSKVTSASPRYNKFLETHPKLRSEAQEMSGNKFTFALYLKDPWKVSNKDAFGDVSTKFFQLAPRQHVYQTSHVNKNYVYFSTLGGGVGIGSQTPIIKNNDIRYQPGNVSLLMDSSLEFAAFRQAGLGGSFNTHETTVYEVHIKITDVEVWGCGGEKELQEQLAQWEWEERESKRRQQINLQSIGEDRALLEMAGIIGNHQSGGSV